MQLRRQLQLKIKHMYYKLKETGKEKTQHDHKDEQEQKGLNDPLQKEKITNNLKVFFIRGRQP